MSGRGVFLGFLYSSFGWVGGIWQAWILKLFLIHLTNLLAILWLCQNSCISHTSADSAAKGGHEQEA